MAQGITGIPPSKYLYWSPRALAARGDPKIALYWVPEQEDADAGDAAGFACIALSDWTKWLDDAGTPIADLDVIDHQRIQYLVPDSSVVLNASVWANPNLKQALYAFGAELHDKRDATVFVIKLEPAAPRLADYLAKGGTAEGLEKLAISLKHKVFKHVAEAHKGAQQKGKNSPSSVDVVAALTGDDTERPPFHPAQDIFDGVLYYGRTVGSDVGFLTSEREVLNLAQLPVGLRPRHTDPGPGSFSKEAVNAWLNKTEGDRGSLAQALDALDDWIRRYIVFRDPRKALLVATWMFGTWLHRGFAIYPYLAIHSADAIYGKSTLVDLISKIAFNSGPSGTLPTPANIYRGADANAGTQLFDEVKLDDAELAAALSQVLNQGFRRGNVVMRSEKQGDGPYKQVPFEVYAPRVFAGVTALHPMLENRSIYLALVRKLDTKDEQVTDFRWPAVQAEAAPLRDRCTLAALSTFKAILHAYNTTADPVLAGVGMKNRAADLWLPLIGIAQVADAEDGKTRVDDLRALVQEQKRLRAAADTEAGTTVAFVQALQTVLHGKFVYGEAKDEARVRPTELLERLRAPGSGFPFIESARKLAALMKPLGFVAGSTRIDKDPGIRAYTIRWKDLEELLERFTPKLETAAE